MRITKILIGFIIILSTLWPSILQASGTPIKTFKLGGGYNDIISGGALEDNWSGNDGYSFFVNAPVTYGNFEFEITSESFTSKVSEAPDYSVWTWALGWNFPIRFIPGFSFCPGFTVGSYKMEFDDPSLPKTAKQEAEYFGSVNARLEFKLYRFTSIYVKYSYKQVYTYHPMKISNLQGGMVFDLDLSDKLTRLID